MYIRRKVFSLLQDETGEERYFSTTDITLEDAEQRIFSLVEDNEASQKEFTNNVPAEVKKNLPAEIEKKASKLGKKDKIALAALATAGIAGGTAALASRNKKSKDKNKK